MNKSEIAIRFNCNQRIVDRYLKIEAGIIEPQKSENILQSWTSINQQ